MRILVTGGTGYLGRAVVAALYRRGHEPVAFARRATVAGDLPGSRIDGDVRDRPAVRDAARGADGIIHCAAIVSLWRRDPADFDRINVGGLETVIDVAAALGTPRLVYTSSFLALPPAGRARPLEANDYQRSKVRAREVARSAASRGLPVVSLVPGVIYGPGPQSEANLVDRMIRDHLAGRLPGIIGADRVWSFTFLEDVAEAHVAAIEGVPVPGEVIVGGENLPQMRLFELLRELRPSRLPRRIPLPAAYALAAMDQVLARGRRAPRLTLGTVKILSHDWPLDSARTVGQLSYRSRPLKDGLRDLLGAAR